VVFLLARLNLAFISEVSRFCFAAIKSYTHLFGLCVAGLSDLLRIFYFLVALKLQAFVFLSTRFLHRTLRRAQI